MNKTHFNQWGFWLALLGFCLWAFASFIIPEDNSSPEARRIIFYFGVILFSIGLPLLLWMGRDRMINRGGPIMLVSGLCIMAVCLLLGLSQPIVAGGFIAVAGAVLLRR